MISYSNKHQHRKWSISLFLIVCVLWLHPSPYFAVEVKVYPLHEYRIKRQVCQDGIQPGGKCCLCPAGKRLDKQCTTDSTPGDRTCVLCVSGRTYLSHPNARDSCEPCTHCDLNARLEEEKPCTVTADTVCKCQPDHYCDKESCKICHPCLGCGDEGVKVDCTPTSNTICNDKKPEGVNVPAAVLIPLLFIILVAGILFYFWRKKRLGRAAESTNGVTIPMADRQATESEMEPFKGVDLSPLLPDIASLLGWRVMRDLAVRGGMTTSAIEACQRNHPNDAEEQALQLLTAWAERQGSTAPEVLVERLRSMEKNAMADKVVGIIKRSGRSGGNNNTGQV